MCCLAMAKRVTQARGLLLELSETLQEKADEFKSLAGEGVAQLEKEESPETPQGMKCTRYTLYISM